MIKPTDKSTLRAKILDVCIKKQELLIGDFKMRMNALLEPEGLGNEEEYDNTQLAQKGITSEELNELNKALSLANEEMSFLEHLKRNDTSPHTVVGPGAIVITDKRTFFISVSIEQFDIDGKTFFGISTKSPLYLTMKGLLKRNVFTYNGIKYKIVDIY